MFTIRKRVIQLDTKVLEYRGELFNPGSYGFFYLVDTRIRRNEILLKGIVSLPWPLAKSINLYQNVL